MNPNTKCSAKRQGRWVESYCVLLIGLGLFFFVGGISHSFLMVERALKTIVIVPG